MIGFSVDMTIPAQFSFVELLVYGFINYPDFLISFIGVCVSSIFFSSSLNLLSDKLTKSFSRLAAFWFSFNFFETTDQFTFIVFLHHDDILARFYFSLVSIDHTFSLIFEHFSELIRYFDTIDINEASVVLCVNKHSWYIARFVHMKWTDLLHLEHLIFRSSSPSTHFRYIVIECQLWDPFNFIHQYILKISIFRTIYYAMLFLSSSMNTFFLDDVKW